jgi:hypothetical protein
LNGGRTESDLGLVDPDDPDLDDPDALSTDTDNAAAAVASPLTTTSMTDSVDAPGVTNKFSSGGDSFASLS